MNQNGLTDWIRYMNNLTIEFEWEDPLSARGAELRATWARLSILIDSCPLTRVFDLNAKSMRKAVYLPLYPLAEWLVERWWSLWTEASVSSSLARASYDNRHSLVHAREGYALPPIKIEPAGSIVRISWHPEVLRFNGLEFTGQGEAWVETSRLKDTFASFIEAVVTRLKDHQITDSRLQEEWAAIGAADAEEESFCECVGALGLDPYDLDEIQSKTIEEVGNLLPKEVMMEFFSSARSEMTGFKQDAQEVKDAIEKVNRNMLDLTALKSIVDVMHEHNNPRVTPWEQGYSFARKLRNYLGLDGKPLKNIDEIGKILGIAEKDLYSAISKFSSTSIPFAALVGTNNQHSPAFILRHGRPVSTVFHFCRALFEYLYDR